MKAITCSGYGAPQDVLRLADVPEPDLADDEVLVEVHAASLNPADWHLVRGVPYVARLTIGLRRPGFTVPGSDFAGRVVAVGRDVSRVAVGDDVLGTSFLAGFGAFAERVAVPEVRVARMPATLRFEDAAAAPLAATTALQALRDHGGVEPGHRVMIIGASGGVGTFAVQIARSLGAEVTGTSSASNAALVRSLGAHHVLDHTRPSAWEGVGGFDVILQAGGTRSAAACRAMLGPEGTLVQISGDSANRWLGPLGRILAGRLRSVVVSQTTKTFTVGPDAVDLDHVAALLGSGALRSVIDSTHPLDAAVDALAHLEDGHPHGKVVLSVSSVAFPLDQRARQAAP